MTVEPEQIHHKNRYTHPFSIVDFLTSAFSMTINLLLVPRKRQASWENFPKNCITISRKIGKMPVNQEKCPGKFSGTFVFLASEI